MSKFWSIQRSPIKFLGSLFFIYFTLSFIQRLVYLVWVFLYAGTMPSRIAMSFFKGLSFDLISGAFLFLIPAVMLLVTPSKWLRWKLVKISIGITSSICVLLAFFIALAEGFFFAEFHSRYNFIAVDYLVYSKEVLNNAIESYPVGWVLFGLLVFWLPFAAVIIKIAGQTEYSHRAFKQRLSLLLLLILISTPVYFLAEEDVIANESHWAGELAKNSLFTLFSAYNRNSIDYKEFYPVLDTKVAAHLAHEWLEETTDEGEKEEIHDREANSEDEESVVRNIASTSVKKDWNVVLVIIESLSAKFMGHFGNDQKLTPNLDRLADEGIFFQNLYATGTRTVRGLEALILSFPPTPGQSILRRPHSQHLFNLGAVFNEKGYQSQFIYGGFAYFDNMQNWFQSNGFEVVDRFKFPSDEIKFTNVWGVCDEDLFDQVLKQGDKLHANKKPFFQAVLTTSNHRPYTYPDGLIDIPSHTGRDGAVKYTDYAIGKFIKAAEKKPWFKNTLFVFVADHNASVAGGANIPIKDYLIPMIFYNPNLVGPQQIAKLSSQIDFAPTLLGKLGFNYQSRFFGQDLLKAKAGRALLGTYQKVALMRQGHMTILAPNKIIESQNLDNTGMVIHSDFVQARDPFSWSDEVKLTIAIYQTASELFVSGDSNISHHFSKRINVRNH